MSKSFLKNKMVWSLGVLLLIGLIILLAFFIWSGNTVLPAHAQGGGPGTGSGAPQAAEDGPFACTIANIAVFPSRIHVFCTTGVTVGTSTVRYFAASGDSANMLTTNRYLVLLNTAYTLGKKVYIYYQPDPKYNPSGCLTQDCRGIEWMFIVP
jgi:hypothetical protein